MRKHLVLTTLLTATGFGGIGGTGHAAPRSLSPESTSQIALHEPAIDKGDTATPFGTCDEVAANDRASCRKFEAAIVDARRTLAIAELANDWSGELRAAFARLADAQESYARAVGTHEAADGDGPTAESAVKDAFLKTLRTVLHSQPALHKGSFDSYDAELNIAYAHVMEARDLDSLGGSIDKAGIRRTERAWLAYRDAFITFAATLDLPNAVEIVQAELTRRRATDLEALLAD